MNRRNGAVKLQNELPYEGALGAVKRIETAITQRNGALEAVNAEMTAARSEAERLLDAARAAGTRAGQERRVAILAQADGDADAIRADGAAQEEALTRQMSEAGDGLGAMFTRMLLIEEA